MLFIIYFLYIYILNRSECMSLSLGDDKSRRKIKKNYKNRKSCVVYVVSPVAGFCIPIPHIEIHMTLFRAFFSFVL